MAPHKPVLLISVLQAVHNNLITSPKIHITPELVTLFKSNWSLLVSTNHDCKFALPFYHLTSDGFWKLIPNPGFENVFHFSSSMRSFANLNIAVDFAIIPDDLLSLMRDPLTNNFLIQTLLDEYFPETKGRLETSIYGSQNLLIDIEDLILNESPEEYRKQIESFINSSNDEEIYIRGGIFKREIPKIYNNTCCISGMKIDATINVSMIDACHIIPFSESYNDTVTNGIALCPNLHRAFDRGLISIDNDYKVVLSSSFREDKSAYSIRVFDGKEILLPKLKDYYPLQENFTWHMRHVFK